MANLPLVSICVPTYQGEAYLEEALESAAQQTYRPLEIIISDAQSTDGTRAIIRDFVQTCRIPVFYHVFFGTGIGANWNHCIEKASGTYIKWLFQDDLLYKECIDHMMEVALSDKRIGLVFSRKDLRYDPTVVKYHEWVQKYANTHLEWSSLKTVNDGTSMLGDKRLLQPPVNKVGEPTCTLFHRRIFLLAGFFRTDLQQAVDLEYYYRAMAHTYVGFVDQALVVFRLHEGQATWKNRNSISRSKEGDILAASLMAPAIFPKLSWRNRLRLRLMYTPTWAPVRSLHRLFRKIINRW